MFKKCRDRVSGLWGGAAAPAVAPTGPPAAPQAGGAPPSALQQVDWQMAGWIGGLLLVIALVLWYAFTSPEFRPAGGGGRSAAGAGTGVGELRPFRARTGNQQLDIAFAYCQHVGTAAANQWTEQTRAHVARLELGMDDYVRRRCLPQGHTLQRIPEPPTSLANLLYAVTYHSNASYDALRPGVHIGFVDMEGNLYYRVIMAAGRGLGAALVPHFDLVRTLGQWSVDLAERLGSVRLVDQPCVCPQHLGIVGSGLYFVPPTDQSSVWQVLANVKVLLPSLLTCLRPLTPT